MKPDWDDLGETFENSKKVIIGDVDCTADSGKSICEKYGVQGYPTLKYFNPPDTEGESYEGERDLKTLKKFAKSLGPACSVDTLNKCNKKQKAALEPYLAMPVDELSSKVADMKGRISTAQESHDAMLKELQAKFEGSEKSLKALKEELEPTIKLMKSAIPKSKEPAAKDEV
mmetsp:Transcript_18244/g.40853  ORF Transcript_18244/g.40853 Transcript_18244/m.40853 type:complete len:172 (-) Transcript_18244:332-847(-)|eukprot:CAMPEP_0181208886 /NCGR_PEP_ID=MMETSP1096-20121128/22363_1 /TAXON_ID=156174 ORGANISM="Chrysochromulina ericina, Strain CCMP281" /NCGR_SAMPLE_ID=MMETSP1096 /ASSEMBLY_ACC=CAM_ASM_000453 /LENGTH=171 /DNA_ID=CAMNT_0023299993 /DNA_START=186 /DNA_END=701 /DNA_ORIENTATION=+